MKTVLIREFRPADAEALVEVRRASQPGQIWTAEVVNWQVRESPADERLRLYVAETEGRVAGFARARRIWDTTVPDQGFLSVDVHPARRGRGAGGALLAAAEEHLRTMRVAAVHSTASDNEASRRFAERHGYRLSRLSRFLRLDLAATLPPTPAVPVGVRMRSAVEYGDDPRALYEADVECSLDEPGDLRADAIDYDHWLSEAWRRPDLDRELTIAAEVDGTVAAFTAVRTDGRGRYWSGMTGTRRAYRGRGLAKLVKAVSLHRARAAGCTTALTHNDGDNAVMMAVNRWLGYRPDGGEWSCLRESPL